MSAQQVEVHDAHAAWDDDDNTPIAFCRTCGYSERFPMFNLTPLQAWDKAAAARDAHIESHVKESA